MAMTMRTPEPVVRTRTAVGLVPPTRLFVCAECRHAQLFAVQPRALCTLAGAASRRRRHARLDFVRRQGDDLAFQADGPRDDLSLTEAAAVPDNAPALAAGHRTAYTAGRVIVTLEGR
jgi:hypothetical protein